MTQTLSTSVILYINIARIGSCFIGQARIRKIYCILPTTQHILSSLSGKYISREMSMFRLAIEITKRLLCWLQKSTNARVRHAVTVARVSIRSMHTCAHVCLVIQIRNVLQVNYLPLLVLFFFNHSNSIALT